MNFSIDNFVITKTATCNQDDSLEKAAKIFYCDKTENLPVLDEQDGVLGVITRKSLAQAILAGARLQTPMINFMEEAIIIKSEDFSHHLDCSLERIVVVNDDSQYMGTISSTDLISTIMEREFIIGEVNSILDSSESSIIAIDTDEKIIVFNKAAEKILKMPAWKAIGKHIHEVSPRTPLPEVLKTGESQKGVIFQYKDQVFITNRTPMFKNETIIGAVTIFQDITELTTELGRIKENQKNFETIMNNSYDAIVMVNSEGIITMYNDAMEKTTGIVKGKAMGRHVSEVIENTRLHVVAKTGKAEIGDVQRMDNKDVVVMCLPILEEEKVVGALGKIIFKGIQEINQLTSKIGQLSNEVAYYKDVVMRNQGVCFTLESIIGRSQIMEELKNIVLRVARSNSTVLIRGESGTGKELFASAIHYTSQRNKEPYVKVNCAAIPENLLESELFGYTEGAFTGAKKGGKKGKFELANKGTIFLDEIGDMPLSMQVKLLRALQEKAIEPVGGSASIPVNVRIIAATNRNLEELIANKLFRSDLYYRLNVIQFEIPPLRDHKEDIPELVDYLLRKLCSSMGCRIYELDRQALKQLLKYDWPGNIRELENVLEHCLNFVEGNIIEFGHLPCHIRNLASEDHEITSLKDKLELTEQKVIEWALKECQGDKMKAARVLGISRASIYQKIDKYGLR